MKNLKRISIIALVIILLIGGACFATSATTSTTPTTTTSSPAKGISFSQSDGNDVFVMDKYVTLNDSYPSNVFILGDVINIGENASFAKDVFILGGTVRINNADISGNLFIAAADVQIDNTNIGTSYIAANTVVLQNSTYCSNTLYVTSQNLDLKSNTFVFKNVNASVSNFSCENDVKISGDLNVDATTIENEASFGSSIVGGKINFTHPETKAKSVWSVILDYLWSLCSTLLLVFVVGAFVKWTFPSVSESIKKYADDNKTGIKALKSFGIGILIPAIIFVVAIIALCVGIGVPVALLGFVALALGLLIGYPVANIYIARLFMRIRKNNGEAIGPLFITSVCVWVLTLIPIVGPIIASILSITGMGIVVFHIYDNSKDSAKITPTKKKSKTE